MRHVQAGVSLGAKPLLMLAYMVLTATLALHHEPWRDEVDSWLMARDASLATIARISPNMGTPVGWYFLIKPFASLGLPMMAQQAITLALIWLAVAILIFQSPFSLAISACWCLSWYLSFEYSVMSRNYTVGVLGVFALLGSYTTNGSSRLKELQWWVSWPLVVFSSVHFLALVPGLMALGFTLDGRVTSFPRRALTTYLWPACLMALCVWILWPTGDGQMSAGLLHPLKWANLWNAISLGVFPFLPVTGCAQFVAPLFICYWFLVCRCGLRESLAFIVMIASVNAIFICVYFFQSLRHCGLNWIILISVAWVGLLKTRLRGGDTARTRLLMVTAGLCVITLVNITETSKRWIQEIQLPFTDAAATGRYLTEHNLVSEPIACRLPAMCSAILGHVSSPIKMWYPGIDQWGTHMFWDKRYASSYSWSSEQAFLRAKQAIHNEQGLNSFLFICTAPIENHSQLALTQLWESPRAAWAVTDERFVIYRWRADARNS